MKENGNPFTSQHRQTFIEKMPSTENIRESFNQMIVSFVEVFGAFPVELLLKYSLGL